MAAIIQSLIQTWQYVSSQIVLFIVGIISLLFYENIKEIFKRTGANALIPDLLGIGTIQPSSKIGLPRLLLFLSGSVFYVALLFVSYAAEWLTAESLLMSVIVLVSVIPIAYGLISRLDLTRRILVSASKWEAILFGFVFTNGLALYLLITGSLMNWIFIMMVKMGVLR